MVAEVYRVIPLTKRDSTMYPIVRVGGPAQPWYRRPHGRSSRGLMESPRRYARASAANDQDHQETPAIDSCSTHPLPSGS
jgi:hypothetical protein